MPHDHPGFDLWEVDDGTHPFPIGEITLRNDDPDFVQAEVDFVLPQAQPGPQTAAERYVGIVATAQLWVALECTTDAAGTVVCEAVLRGRHLHFYPEHGESEAGPRQEIRLTAGEMRAFGRREALAAHGGHCDLFSASWAVRPATIHCELTVLHVRNSVRGLIDSRARTNREAERLPRPRGSTEPRPTPPAPRPAPDPLPEGAMKPVRPIGALLALVRRAWRGLFG